MYTEKNERIICKHEGCGNECPPERTSTRGFKIQYRQCHTCSCLISNYKVNNGQRKEMLKKQDNKCAICSKEISFKGQTNKGDDSKDAAVLDHCHTTGEIRGILCTPCNRALGLFKDSQDILNSAIKYINQN
jgi:hypothetical protein